MPYFHPFTAYFGGFEGDFCFILSYNVIVKHFLNLLRSWQLVKGKSRIVVFFIAIQRIFLIFVNYLAAKINAQENNVHNVSFICSDIKKCIKDLTNKNDGVFPSGDVVLNGKQALEFCRVRYTDKDGDVSRVARQRQVVNALIDKCVNASLSDINEVFDVILANVRTNIPKKDILSYALFPQVATDFFKYREAQQTGVDANLVDTKNQAYPV